MQFYIIHREPAKNAELLPDYAIKKVNVREGYQIISDIGHALGVTWEGQNKCYNATHPITLRFYRNQDSLIDLLSHYRANLHEYERRFGKKTVFHDRYENVPIAALVDVAPFYDDDYDSVIRYMLKHKSKHLTHMEITRLESLIK